ncbi:MAG: ABC transporter ATP-binding protein, partial [Actinobacteria bacterium]|nr:ABC transporter ATP-binding protein [Actinomycetota bacterium]
VMSEAQNIVALDVRSLTIRYGDLTAVNDITFSARHGEVTAVLGRNGAGKTSTIEACEGLRRTTAGAIRVLGADITRADGALRARIGVMLQDGGIAPNARVRQLVRHYCVLHDRGADGDELLSLVGLQHRADSTWRRLSGGERQRFSLALALTARPEIIFLDEPTAGLDIDGREAVRQIIAQLVRDGCCVVLATHDLDEAERVAQHVVVLHGGRVVLNDRLAAVLATGRRLEDVVREVTR